MIFGREPAAWAGVIKVALALAVAFGLGWTNEQVGLVNAAAAAILGVYVAWATTHTVGSALIAALEAALALAVGFGLHLSGEQTGLLIAFSATVLSLLNRNGTSPAAVGSFHDEGTPAAAGL